MRLERLVAWRRWAIAVCLCVGAAVQPARAWGPLGHEIVGRLAVIQMSPEARAAAKTLLDDHTLADVSMWADNQRGEYPETARWHYVNIPRFRDSYDPKRDCAPAKGSCAIAAIERFRGELANPKTPRAERTTALKFLVHLVADLHQPLHCIDDGDGGGNDLRVRFFSKRTNLHWVWDTGLLGRFHLEADQFVRLLNHEIAARDRSVLATGTPADWALESHAIAVADAYDLPVKSWPYLGRRYLADNRSVVELQLMRAAVRLARVLDEALAR